MSYIAIEGNIGAGKSSLVRRLARDFNINGIYEKYRENPFLEKFYKSPDRFALHVELGFLAERYRQMNEEIKPAIVQSAHVVSDYHFSRSDIFARVNLGRSEYLLFQGIFRMMQSKMVFPELYVFLNVPIYILADRIKRRGRQMENRISTGYMEALNNSYMQYIQSMENQTVVIVNAGDIDFVRNDLYFRQIKEIIFDFKLNKRINHVNL